MLVLVVLLMIVCGSACISIAELLPRQVISHIDCPMLIRRGLLLVWCTTVDSVECSTCHIYDFREVTLSIALRFLVLSGVASLVVERLDGRIVLLRLSGQVGRVHLV